MQPDKKYDEQYTELEGALDGPAAAVAALLNKANEIAAEHKVPAILVGLVAVNADEQQYATIVGVHRRPGTAVAFGAAIATMCSQDARFAKEFTMGLQLTMDGADSIKVGESLEEITTIDRPN